VSQFILALLGEQYVSPLILRFDLIFQIKVLFFCPNAALAGLRNNNLKGGTSK